MKAYVTGSRNRQKVEELAHQLRERGWSTVLPFDLVEGITDEHDALRARMHALLDCEVLVTTAPNDGEWSEGARAEVATARIAYWIKVLPAVRALGNATQSSTP